MGSRKKKNISEEIPFVENPGRVIYVKGIDVPTYQCCWDERRVFEKKISLLKKAAILQGAAIIFIAVMLIIML